MSEDYRFSSYSIVVPLDREPENVFMMHGYTGAIDVLSKEIAEYLQGHEHFSKEEVPCSETTVEVLEKRGYITKWSKEEEVEYAKRLANALYRKENILNNNFTVVVTYDCNFRCPYCFEKGIKKDTTTFTKEMTDKLYKTILEIAPERKLRNNIIVLYGGEPLLKNNKEAVTYLIEEGKKHGFKFAAITNGYDLNHYEDLLGEDSICSVQISVDGLPERHNQQRRHKLGIPTFDQIVQNIGVALNKGTEVHVRINTNRDNIEEIEKLQELLSSLYCDKLLSLHVAMIQDFSSVEPSKENFSIEEFIDKTLKFKGIEVCNNLGVIRKISAAIKNNSPLHFHASPCSSQTKAFVFDPLGQIFACWEVIGQKKHCIGNYQYDEIQWNVPIYQNWKQCTIVNQNCIKCKFAFLCSGGCPVYRLNNSNICTNLNKIINSVVNKAYAKFNN